MKLAGNILLKVLGILLLTGAILKGWQLLNEPVANSDIWSYRPFLVLTVEFELALAIWLLSGLFKKAAWLASLLCFSLFSMITFYKGITGAASCGCFGSVHVNPWITLFAIDLPSVIALSIFRPGKVLPPHIMARIRLHRRPVKALINQFFNPLPSLPHFLGIFVVSFVVLAVTSSVLVLSKPLHVIEEIDLLGNEKLVILEPEAWIDRRFPLLKSIDVEDNMASGDWAVVLYNKECDGCAEFMHRIEDFFNKSLSESNSLRCAVIEIMGKASPVPVKRIRCIWAELPEDREWFAVTPAVICLRNGIVTGVYSRKALESETEFKFIS